MCVFTAALITTCGCGGTPDNPDGTSDIPDAISADSAEDTGTGDTCEPAGCLAQGVCAAGTVAARCGTGTPICDYSAVEGFEPFEQSCDSIDNDCDGLTDEGLVGIGCPARGCAPDCGERECGGDGCGDHCGTCGERETCDPAGSCICAPGFVGNACDSCDSGYKGYPDCRLDATYVATGTSHACAILADGGVKCWGSNNIGCLGDGSFYSRPTPVDVVGLTGKVTKISAGNQHTCALLEDKSVECWGYSLNGQVGAGNFHDMYLVAATVPSLTDVRDIAAGGSHTCALLSDGTVKCWGSNSYGQLGNGQSGEDFDSVSPVDVSGLSNVVAVVAGNDHTCALLETGAVMCWGENTFRQLGDPAIESRAVPVAVAGLSANVVSISAGGWHNCVLYKDGSAACWGDNGYGQLGNGTSTTSFDDPTPTSVNGLSGGLTAISCGSLHTCGILENGDAMCWGANFNGEIGDGSWGMQESRTVPVNVNGLDGPVSMLAAGGSFTCALLTGGGIDCWGDNGWGQLGNDWPHTSRVPAAVSGMDEGAAAVYCGDSHTCAVMNDGAVWCWGENINGQLGYGTAETGLVNFVPYKAQNLPATIREVATGYAHTCALATDGDVFCWGHNGAGQLGNGTSGTITSKLNPVKVKDLGGPVRSITANELHTCALLESGAVKCWGSNYYGEIGDGTLDSRPTPVQVSGLESGVAAITAGAGHVCAILESGAVRCWGSNYNGQLGNGGDANSSIPVDVTGLLSPAVSLSAGGFHTCAVLEDGGVWCWGYNFGGALGNGTDDKSPVPVMVTGPGGRATTVECGRHHSCAVLESGEIQCWGYNALGQLGDGTTADALTPAWVGGIGALSRSVSAGGAATCAVTEAGGIMCWGANDVGQLGIGEPAWSVTPVAVHN